MSESTPVVPAGALQVDSAPTGGRRSGWAATSGNALITAIAFLTRVPISSAMPSAQSLRTAPLFFPLVGMLIGVFTAGLLGSAALIWPVWLAVIVALAAEALLTGALHEDGLADFCDGFGGGWTRERILEILTDSRIGTYGTLGLGFAVTLRAGSLMSIVAAYGQEHWIHWSAALVASAAIARWMIVLAMVLLPPIANRESLSRDVASSVSWSGFAVSGLGAALPIALFIYLMPVNALLACVMVVIAVTVLTSLIRRKLGGITGDCLGCIGCLSQVLVLLAAAARVA